jgi:hypothetical protein
VWRVAADAMRRVISTATRVEPGGRDDARLGWPDDSHHDRMVGGFEEFEEGFDGVVGSDEEAACLLPVVISELVTGLERLVGRAEVEAQINGWLDEGRPVDGLMFLRRSVASGGPARGNRRRKSWRGTALGPRQSELLAAARVHDRQHRTRAYGYHASRSWNCVCDLEMCLPRARRVADGYRSIIGAPGQALAYR